jgi:hypothetical protein
MTERGILVLIRYTEFSTVGRFTLLFCRIVNVAFMRQQFHTELYQNNIILLNLTARGIYNVKASVYVV